MILDRAKVSALSKDIMAAIEAVAAKHDVKLTYKGARFSNTSATFKIEAAVVGENGVAETRERTDFTLHAPMFGLKPEWLDKSFTTWNGSVYTIIGLAMSRHKNPVVAADVSGKRYVFPVAAVVSAMAMNKV